MKDQLAALASRQKQHKGGWEVLVVITGTPDWAARPGVGCERPDTQPRSRAPKASAMADYRKLVEDVIALGGQVGVKLRYWSAWNEPNHPFFISPQRATCDASAPSLAVKRYAEITRNLKRALDDAPGDQQYVLGELAGLDASKSRSTSIQEFLRELPTPIVCGSTMISQHGYVSGINPVDARHQGRRDPPLQEEARRVDDRDRRRRAARRPGQADERRRPSSAPAASSTSGLKQWYDDPRVTAAFQYTFREDDIFRTGLVTTALDRAFPVLREWQAWGGEARPKPTDPPPSHANCSRTCPRQLSRCWSSARPQPMEP